MVNAKAKLGQAGGGIESILLLYKDIMRTERKEKQLRGLVESNARGGLAI